MRIKTWLAGFAALTATSCSLIVDQNVHNVSKLIIKHSSVETPVPPSFLGHPLAYAAAVFGQLTVFSVSMAVIFFQLSALNLRRDRTVRDGKVTWKSPVNVYRMTITSFMICTALWATSNLIIYLMWNEISPDSSTVVYTIEKSLKAFISIPFLYAVYLMVSQDEVITSQLVLYNYAPVWPEPYDIKSHGWMMVWVVLLSAGITYAKWRAYVAL